MPNDTDATANEVQIAITVTATAVKGASVSLITPDNDNDASNGASVDLAVGTPKLITVTVVAQDGETQQSYTVTAGDGSRQAYTVTVTRAAPDPSTDATLSALSLSDNLTLIPDNTTFDPQTMAYPATAPFDLSTDTGVQNRITVTATPDSGGTVGITPADADTTEDGHQVDLSMGSNTITVRVTEGLKSNSYTVTVTRIAANDASLASLSLSAGELSPKFAAGTTAYTASVPNDSDATANEIQSAITVTATPVKGASVQLITPGTFDSDAGASTLQNLAADTATLFTVTVVAPDGETQQSYTVTATREASDDATLSDLTIDGATVTGFAATTTEYTATVGNNTASIAIEATATNSEANEPVILPADAAADIDGHQVNLAVGDTVITATVTAEDGSTQTYTVTVTRGALPVSGDLSLSGLTLTGITDVTPSLLQPDFSTETAAYSASVEQYVTSTTVTATATDRTTGPAGAGASVTITPADADADDSNGHQVNLDLGENTISVIVASSDGTTITTYTVIRAYGGATLTALSLSDVTLSPDFSPDVTSYSASVASGVENTVVKATAVVGATVTPTGVTGNDGHQASLSAGSNTIKVVVTSSDGTARTTYSVSVFRVHAVAHLTALSLGDDVALSPAFAASTTS